MKHQQVKVDYLQFLKVSASCILLTFTGWVFIRMIYAVFLLPRIMQNSQLRWDQIQRRNELMTALADQIEKLEPVDNSEEKVDEIEGETPIESTADEEEPSLDTKKDN